MCAALRRRPSWNETWCVRRRGRSAISSSSLLAHLQFEPVDAGIGTIDIAGAIMLHDGLRASVRAPGDVADRQQVAAGAIEQHHACIAQVLVVCLIEFAGDVDEYRSYGKRFLRPWSGFLRAHARSGRRRPCGPDEASMQQSYSTLRRRRLLICVVDAIDACSPRRS